MAYNFPDSPALNQTYLDYTWDGEKWISTIGGIARTDLYWTNVKLLMGFNGTNGSTGAPGMNDESSAAHGTGTITVSSQISTAQSVFGGSSLSVSNSRVYFPDHNDWNLSNRRFTIECRIYPTSVTGTQFIIDQWAGASNLGWVLYLSGTGLWFNNSTTGSDNNSDLGSSGITLTVNTWYAICVDFDGTKYRMYIDGVMRGSSTTLRTINDCTQPLAIGASGSTGFPFFGYIDELRITMDVARYASDSGYTVPTIPFPRG